MHETDRQRVGRFEQQLAANKVAVAVVHVGIVDDIVIETVTLEIHAVDARGDRFADGGVDPAFDLDCVVVAVSERAVATEIEFGRCGVDVDQAGRAVAPAERALRAAQHFDPVDRTELAERVTRTRAIDAVDEHRDRAFEAGVVADGADAADTGRAIGFVTGRGHQQRRRDLAHFANVRGAGIAQLFTRNDVHRHRDIGQFLRTALRGDDDDRAIVELVFHVADGALGIGRLLLREQGRLRKSEAAGKCAKRDRAFVSGFHRSPNLQNCIFIAGDRRSGPDRRTRRPTICLAVAARGSFSSRRRRGMPTPKPAHFARPATILQDTHTR